MSQTQPILSDAVDRCMKKLGEFKADVARLLSALDASWDIVDQQEVKKYNALADAADEVRKWL
jgi:hypothetical protein